MASFTSCPSCGQTLRLADALRDRDARCPDCHCTFVARVRDVALAESSAKAAEPAADPSAPMLELDDAPNMPAPSSALVLQPYEPVGRPAPRLRTCPHCREPVTRMAFQCRFCGRELGDPDVPEWDNPHALRRDFEPHRGGLVLALGIIGLVGSLIHVFAIVGVPLCIAALVMAIHDLRQIDQRMMDPSGRSNTQAGKVCAIVGLVFGFLWISIFGLAIAGAILE